MVVRDHARRPALTHPVDNQLGRCDALPHICAGCVAKTTLSAKPNQPPISSVDYSAFNPRISRMN